jgi:hypothetical protein
MTHPMLALFNIGGGEIILILALLVIMLLVPAVVIAVVLLIVRATRKTSNNPPPTAPPPIQSGRPENLVMIKCQSCGKLNGQDAKFCQECGRKL